MRAGVAFTRIRLDLGNSHGHRAIVIRALNNAAENFGRDIEYLTGEKLSMRQVKSSQHAHSVRRFRHIASSTLGASRTITIDATT